MITRIRGFSGSGFETIAGLKVALGLERVDLVDTVFSVKPFTASRSEEGCHRARSGQGQGAPSARGPSLTSPARVPAGRSGRRDDRRTIEQRDVTVFRSCRALKSSLPFLLLTWRDRDRTVCRS